MIPTMRSLSEDAKANARAWNYDTGYEAVPRQHPSNKNCILDNNLNPCGGARKMLKGGRSLETLQSRGEKLSQQGSVRESFR
jgi:hypothetical protein